MSGALTARQATIMLNAWDRARVLELEPVKPCKECREPTRGTAINDEHGVSVYDQCPRCYDRLVREARS